MAVADLRNIDAGDFASWPTWLRMVGTVVVCVVIVFAGYWFVVKQDIADLGAAQRKERDLRQVFLKKKELAVNLPAYTEQMKEIEARFGLMLQQLPDKTEVPELLIDITQAGLARGLQFVMFKPQPRQIGDFYATLPVDLKVVGSYHQLAEFVSDLAAMPRIVTLGNIAIQPEHGGNNQLVMTAVTRTYHYVEDQSGQGPTGGGKDKPVRMQRGS